MINPLQIWNNRNVTSLLVDFYEANFQKAGIPNGLGKEIVVTAFDLKGKVSESDLKKQINTLFLTAKTYLNETTSEKDKLTLIDFSNVKSFLDIGTNRMDTLNKIGRFFPHVDNLFGLDIIPLNGVAKYPDKTIYYQIDPNNPHYPIKEKSIDVINIQYALHHFANENVIKETIRKCREVLSTQGRIILWEESFEDHVDLKNLVEINQYLGFFTDYELTKRFYDLDEPEKLEFIIANDWIINVNNSHMQWTGMYKKWEDWTKLFKENGLILKEKLNFGLRISGHVKSGVHIMGEFVCNN